MKIKWHKLKLWEPKVVRRMLGGPLLGVTGVMSLLAYPTQAFNYEVTNELINSQEIVVTTDQPYLMPVEQLGGVSQGYHLLHAGVDLRAPKGATVVAMSQGMVIEVEQMTGGYGHFVRIAHEGTLSSLYAHLDQVVVKTGQRIAKGETLGTVGLTGWTTGPHLHFEVYEGNRTINPMKLIAQ